MTFRRQDGFESELGGLPFEESSREGLAVALFGALTGTASGLRDVYGAAAATGTFTATATGTREVLGVAVITLGGLTATASGEATSGTTGTADGPLGGLTSTATGTRTALGVAVIGLGGLTSTALGSIARTGVATALLGALTATARQFVTPPPTVSELRNIQRLRPQTLGCGGYTVWFKFRGGQGFVCEARKVTQLSFSRTLNEVSEARVEIKLSGQDDTCCECIGGINSWEHEIAIYRDGREVWAGPVVNGEIDLDIGKAVFEAKDLMAWADHRWVELQGADYDVEEVDASIVFEWLLRHGYDKDPWYMDWDTPSESGVVITKFYPAYDNNERWGGSYPTIGEEIRSLSKSGVDFTMIGRTLVAGGLETKPPLAIPTLHDHHWRKLPKIKISGGTMATELAIAGGRGGYSGWADDQMWIERPNDEFRQRFGLLQRSYVESGFDDVDTSQRNNAIAQQAHGMRELKKQPFLYIAGGELSSKAPVDFNSLVPGATTQVALTQTCRKIESQYRLQQVDVSFDGENESIALQLTPEGVAALSENEIVGFRSTEHTTLTRNYPLTSIVPSPLGGPNNQYEAP